MSDRPLDLDALVRALADAPPLIAVVRGRDHQYAYLNNAYRALGRIFGEPLGKPYGVGSGVRDHDRIRDILDRVYVTGEAFRARELAVRVDASGRGEVEERFYDLVMQPTRAPEGEVDGVLVCAVDVTALVRGRLHAEAQGEQLVRQREALRASEARFRRVVESNMCGMLFWDKSGVVTGANDAFLKIVGYSRQDLVEGRINWLAMTPPDWMDAERRAHAELAERGVCTPFEKEYVTNGGARVPILIGGALLQDSDAGGVAFVLDLTERKRADAARAAAEDAQRNLQAQLLHVQKLESLGVLAGGIAHDFNNLLTGVLGNASLALRSLPEGSPARGPLEDVVDAAERAGVLTRQLLAYAGKAAFDVRAVDLSAEVGQIAHLLDASLPKKVELDLALAEGLPAIDVDVAQLQQVVMNLVLNAAEAIDAPRGSVRLTSGVVRLDEEALTRLTQREAARPGRFVFLEVEDDGKGMDEATKKRLFDPFFTTKLAGRGLGLAATLGIVRGHAGAMHLESALGEARAFACTSPPPRGARAVAPSPP